jgi:hypothetical protein
MLHEAKEKFTTLKENDNIKNEFCKENEYKLIRINHRDFENILGILCTELNDIIDWTG